jgi:hypothetical protein
MKKDDAELLKKLIGKKVVEVRVDLNDPHDYGFDLVFDDGTVLEVYDIRCSKFDEECKNKPIKLYDFETGEEVSRNIDVPLGGGVAWTISKQSFRGEKAETS